MLSGCRGDMLTTTSSAEAPKTSASAAPIKEEAKVFKLGEIRVRLLNASGVEGALDQENVSAWFREQLSIAPIFSSGDSAPTGASALSADLSATYRVAMTDVGDGSGQIVGSVFVR